MEKLQGAQTPTSLNNKIINNNMVPYGCPPGAALGEPKPYPPDTRSMDSAALEQVVNQLVMNRHKQMQSDGANGHHPPLGLPSLGAPYGSHPGGIEAQQQASGGAYPPIPHLPNFSQMGLPRLPSAPIVSVTVEGVNFSYQLTEDDLRKVFSRYGEVREVTVNPDGGSAIIRFSSMGEAEHAVRDLHGKTLNGVRGSLSVQWHNTGGTYGKYNSSPSIVSPDDDGMDGGRIRKYTCRFEIGIENDREFHVARRLIGQKGANMKRIVKLSNAKLRLRGQGSGFLEGTAKEESHEPLHMCVSCKDPEGYRIAVSEMRMLLEQVYGEYRLFCRERNIPYPEDLQVLVKENPLVSSPRAATDASQTPALGGNGKRRYGRQQSGYSSYEGDHVGSGGLWNGGEFHPVFGPSYGGDADHFEMPPGMPSVEEIERLIEERNNARRVCNFKEADRIRDLLKANGIGLMDEPGGRGRGSEVTTWRFWRQ
ncbi:hypothetical protein Pmar_PMAR005139 [Perkinsus marinus ATCC 50983]|uniref:RRM domain-containing protein n=1 Tax=Perkinsus marinus (strain ATCC 50983 / TXsc) TaxID=423536 RepID=C5KAQ8_PERM5|nr:hypothetical protein Pmar_PMAR005139 [Perkinsus marinus ATCC 50983]EER18234.1 hypothetical protein Pmar_PMAR005139 [Perkinsus marinus ATCC 50983]|eukprot:XP_002786438.1 hypothetical protein Pmar_PMAR005139 [Perkinsus marinus ATCC 50983]